MQAIITITLIASISFAMLTCGRSFLLQLVDQDGQPRQMACFGQDKEDIMVFYDVVQNNQCLHATTVITFVTQLQLRWHSMDGWTYQDPRTDAQT